MTPTEKAKRSEALYYDNHNITRRTLCDRVVNLESDMDEIKAENAKLQNENARLRSCLSDDAENARMIMGENAKLREQLERVQPTDCEGNALDIADTVHMLRSEYDGDHEWEDVVTELVLTKWGGDRWIVRGSKGEAWACDCTKTGYDEDAYEASDDVEPFDEPTLLEVENAKLRELVRIAIKYCDSGTCDECPILGEDESCPYSDMARELGIEVTNG